MEGPIGNPVKAQPMPQFGIGRIAPQLLNPTQGGAQRFINNPPVQFGANRFIGRGGAPQFGFQPGDFGPQRIFRSHIRAPLGGNVSQNPRFMLR